jgi:tRNA threonylcarbamoyladenosine biosynthesis protein TsaB
MLSGNLLEQKELDFSQRTAQSLAPGMRSLLEQVGWQPVDVDLVAVTVGPGSFTGLRVGVATAKTFAYATGAGLLGVDTLETIATAAPADVPALWAAVDAQRGEVVARSFHRAEDGWLRACGSAKLIDARQWLCGLPAGTVITGSVLRKLVAQIPAHLTVLDEQCWFATAANLARLAHRDYLAGRRDDLWQLVPHYSRRSAAEEKWDSRGRGSGGGGQEPNVGSQGSGPARTPSPD